MRARIGLRGALRRSRVRRASAGAGYGGDDEPTASPPTTETTHQGHTPTATPTTPTATPTPPDQAQRPDGHDRRPTGTTAGGIKTYTVKKGEKIALVVRSDAGESVPARLLARRADRRQVADPDRLHGEDTLDGSRSSCTIRTPSSARSRSSRDRRARDRRRPRLPIPEWMLYWGAAIVLVISFVLLGVLWKSPQLSTRTAGRPAPDLLSRIFLSRCCAWCWGRLRGPARAGVRLGRRRCDGSVPESGPNLDLHRLLARPAAALRAVRQRLARVEPLARARGCVRVGPRARRRDSRAARRVSEPVGTVACRRLLFAFAALELAYTEPSSPRALAVAMRSTPTSPSSGWRRSAARHGRGTERRSQSCSGSSRSSRRGSRPTAASRIRIPFAGLSVRDATPGTVAFIAVMLGSVGFDGYSRTTTWLNLTARIEAPYIVDNPRLGDLLVTSTRLAGLLVGCGLVAAAFLAACAVAADMVDTDRPLAADFVLSLVPIALVYEVAHYFYLHHARPVHDPAALRSARPRLGRARHCGLRAEPGATVVHGRLLRAVHGARRGPHGRARDRTRPRRHDLHGPTGRAAVAVRHACLMVLYTVGGLWLLRQG